MKDHRPSPPDPFAGFVVDRVTKQDGRYLLYYRWTDAATAERRDPAEPPQTGDRATGSRSAGPAEGEDE